MFSSIETHTLHELLTTLTLTETTEDTLPSHKTPQPPELITTPMFNNLLKCTNENALLKGKILDLITETESMKMFMKEELFC